MADSNPELEAVAAWSTNLYGSVFTFAVVTLIFIGLTVLIFSFSNIAEISKNFAQYRCNPLMMPFAGQFGYDAKENFQFCISNILNNKVAEIFAPLYGLLSQFVGILTVMMNATLGIRKLFSNFFLSVNNFVGNVRNKIQNLLLQIRMSFLKLNNLMGRVFGTMFAVIFMGMSALTAANNTANNDLVKFLAEFCFDPQTPVQLESGAWMPIREIAIGDRLAVVDGVAPVVTSTFRFDGQKTPMVKVDDVLLSSEHYISNNGAWIPAAKHPRAVAAPSVAELVCLNVTGNKFFVGRSGLLARDYDEHTDDAAIVAEAQRIASCALNGVYGATVADYSLGFDPAFEIRMRNKAWKPSTEVRIGDVLESGATVVGIVRERCASTLELPLGGKLAAAQLIHDGKQWIRGSFYSHTTTGSHVLIQLMTSNCGVITARYGDIIYHLRDYREVPLPEMETPYAEGLAAAAENMRPKQDEQPVPV